MSNKFAALGALAGVIATGAAATQAQAMPMSIEQTQSFTVAVEELSFGGAAINEGVSGVQNSDIAPLSFDVFDTNLGTLTGVRAFVSLEGAADLTAELTGNAGSEGFVESASASFQAVFNFGLEGESNVFGTQVTASGSCSDTFGCVFEDTAFFSSGESSFSDLAAFTGPVDVVINAILTTTTNISSSENLNSIQSSVDVDAIVNGVFRLEYQFDAAPTSVAEPGSVALLGFGLAGIAAASRRKRQA